MNVFLQRSRRRPISPPAAALTRDYLLNPAEHWGVDGRRHVRKIEAAISSAIGSGGGNVESVIEEALAIGRLRTVYAGAPIFVPNVGSSGSHWLEAMLSCAPRVSKCGEVYFPRAVLERLRASDDADREFFFHVVYALHSRRLGPRLAEGRFVNSAHHSRISILSSMTPRSETILLIRNPVDIVLSRTFRKSEYRQEIAAGMNDREYLLQNCSAVRKFYEVAIVQKHDLVVKYEELRAAPHSELHRIVKAFGLAMNDNAIAKAVHDTNEDTVRARVADGGFAGTNLYLGHREPVDATLLTLAINELSDVCRKLEYPPYAVSA